MKKPLIVILALSIMLGHSAENLQKTPMRPGNSGIVAHCVGRLTLDLPNYFARAPVTIGSFKFIGMDENDPEIDVVVEEFAINSLKFEQRIQARIAELKNASDDNVNIIRYEKHLSDRSFLVRVQEIEDAYRSEIMVLKGSSLVTAKLDSFRNQYEKAEIS